MARSSKGSTKESALLAGLDKPTTKADEPKNAGDSKR